jgi:ketosteroid isomerase-like protein
MLAIQKPEVEQVVSQGDTVVILLTEHGTFKLDGRDYAVRGVQWFNFRDGKISRIDEIFAPLAR